MTQMKRQQETMKKELKNLATEIRRRRLERGLSQVAFAHLCDISNKQLDNIEAARNWPSMPVYITICKVLDLERPPLLDAPILVASR